MHYSDKFAYHEPELQHQFEDMEQQEESVSLGMGISVPNQICGKLFVPVMSARNIKILMSLLMVLIGLQTSESVFALNPVYVKDFTVGGNATRFVNGQWVPNAGVPVLLKTRSYLGVPGYRVLLSQSQIVLITDDNGHFETQVPCYIDGDNQYNTQMEGDAATIGASGGASGWGGGVSCSYSSDQYKNVLGPRGDTTEQDNQNFGGEDGCPTKKSVGRPVNTTNGNVWLRQRDYNLPGIGENIKIDRFYNSLLQEPGLFGFGWKTDYDESVANYNNDYIIWRAGDGRGYYFANVGNNVFASASAGFTGQFVKNTDNTYTLTFKDGRSRKFGTTGKLLWLKDRNGNQTTVNYDTGGVITGITDPFARTLTFTTGSNGAVSLVSDATGTVATYEYFTGTTHLKTVTYGDGSKYKFEYTNITIGGQTKTFLTTVKDALDNILETHAYDSAGRATTSEVDGGVEEFTLDYSNWNATLPYTSVTDAVGNVTKYYFDRSKGLNVITKIEGLCGCGGSGSETTTFQYDYKLNLVKKTDALSNETTYTYDNDSNLISITDPLGTQSFIYNSFGQVLTHKDRMGGGTTNTYSGSGNLLTTTHSLYPSITWTNKVGVAESPTGTITRNTGTNSWGGAGAGSVESLSADGRMVYIVGETGTHRAIGLGYVDSNQNSTDIDFAYSLNTDGNAYIYENGTYANTGVPYTSGTVLEIERTGTTIYYKKNGIVQRTVTGVSPSALYVDTAIYSNGGVFKDINLISATDTAYPKTTLTYTSLGQLSSITDPRNNTTSFTYDSSGRLIQVTDANDKDTDFTYNARAQVTSVTNALNLTTEFEYDDNSRLNKITHPDTNEVTFEYDLAGRRTSVTDELGHETIYAYDDAYRLTGITDPLTHTTSFAYDLMSNMTSQTDALGNVTNFEYDDFDRLKKIKHPLPSPSATPRLEESFTYDKLGNIRTKVDSAGRTTSYDYDTASRLTKVTDALTNQTQFEYNARSQMTKVKDALNQEYVFTYDHLGRQLSLTRAGTTMSFEYDAVGNRTKQADYSGKVSNYTYDNLNRLTNIAYSGSTDFATYVYDELSRPTSATNQNGAVSFAYDNRGRTQSTTDVFNQTISYGYDAASNRNLLKINGVNYATYAYDIANRLTGLTSASDMAQITFAYDNANRLTSRSYPNTVNTTYEYDGMSRLTRLKDASPTATLFDRQLGYNPANQISQIAEPALTRNFGYDNVDRLTGVTNPTATSESYSFDAVGNRNSSHLSASYGYQPFNRLVSTTTTSYSYDANANVLSKTAASGNWTYEWDYEDRLTKATKSSGELVTYKYDALGRRTTREKQTPFIPPLPPTIETTNFVYDGLDVIQDRNGAGLVTASYLNGPGIDNKLRQTVGVNTSYYLADHLGSTNGLTDILGNVTSSASYDSFGNSTNTLATRYQFTGREFDGDTGLHYYRARWYDSNLGRFISEDPIGFKAGDVNLYAYVNNRPLFYRDPSGLDGTAVWQNPNIWPAVAGSLAALGGLLANPAVVAGGGFAVGYGIGYYPGQWTANHPNNPFVRGPWNPWGNPYPISPPMPPSIVRPPMGPVCQPMPRAIPWTKSPSIPLPFNPPDNGDECEAQYETDSAICRYLPSPGARARCWASAMERRVACDRKLPYIPPLITH